jgi:hypothetical protein
MYAAPLTSIFSVQHDNLSKAVEKTFQKGAHEPAPANQRGTPNVDRRLQSFQFC